MSERRTASALAYLHPDFCFIMDDDSMESAGIRAGDIVAFTACDHAEDGQIVAVQTDSAVLLLRLICNGELPGARREDHRASRGSPAYFQVGKGRSSGGPAVKVKITYTPEQESAAQATLDALRAMFPAARVHESAKKAGVSAVFLTVTKPEKPHNTKQNS